MSEKRPKINSIGLIDLDDLKKVNSEPKAVYCMRCKSYNLSFEDTTAMYYPLDFPYSNGYMRQAILFTCNDCGNKFIRF